MRESKRHGVSRTLSVHRDSPRRVALLLRSLAVVYQDLMNDRQELVGLGLRSRPGLAVAGWLIVRQDLREPMPAETVLLTGATLAQLVRQHQPTNLFPKLNVGSRS